MKEKILALRAEGLTYNQIVEKLGCAKSTVSYYCGIDQPAKRARRARDRRSKIVKYVQEYKQERGCQDCGEQYPYWILELDHVRGVKICNVSNMKNLYSLEQVKEELKKCEVVCSNCHKTRTWNRLHSSGSSVLDVSEYY